MSTKTQSELSKFFGPVVATGAERICVRNLNNEFSCFKISKKIHSKETRREIKYFKFLKKRGISSSFIPSFISDFETKDEVIIEQELIAVNFQRFPTLDAKKLVNAPKMSAHHRGICHF